MSTKSLVSVSQSATITQWRETYWPLSLVGCLKMNVDATNTIIMGVGAIVQNCHRKVKVAMTKRMIGIFSPKIVGAQAFGISLELVLIMYIVRPTQRHMV